MLRLISGRSHEVLTGICVAAVSDAGPGGLRPETFPVELDRTMVWFAALEPDEIGAYLDADEWTDKAGAYGIQGFASRFIPRIEGSYTNVVGLPVARVYTLLKSLKIPNFR
jgi:septum formation protein